MRTRILLSIILITITASIVVEAQTPAPAAGKAMTKDEVYFSLARKLNSINESPASAIVAELDGVIEVTNVAMGADGKATVTVKEREPSSAAYTNKSTRLIFTPPPTGDKWTWEQFEENRRFYPVDKLFPYAKDELGKRRQMSTQKWGAFVAAVNKQAESAHKALETAKAVLKADPPPMAALTATRAALTEASKENKIEETLNAYRELQRQNDPITTLGDAYSDLKANDAYLRLIEEFKNAINVTNAARRDYAQSVAAYNESLVRLPFALVAYGLQFTKINANLEAE
jgi:LemA protein